MPTHAQRMIFAVRTRNHAYLEQLLADRAKAAETSAAGRTTLHAAAEEGDRKAAEILIAAGVDVNARMYDGKTALHQAVAYGKGWDLKDPDGERRDPWKKNQRRKIHPAVANVLADLVKEQNPAITGVLDPRDLMPEEIKPEIFSSLLDFFADSPKLLHEINSRGIDVDSIDPVFAESLRGNPRFLSLAKFLLDQGADAKAADKYGNTALSLAVEFGTAEMVELVIQRGGGPETELRSGETADKLYNLALGRSKIGVADVLWAHGFRFGQESQGLVSEAASNGREKALNWLLGHGANFDTAEPGVTTPLLNAARRGHADSVATLLEAGADAFARDDEGNTLFHESAYFPDCIKLAMKTGAPINEVNAEGKAPLHIAASGGDADAIRLLVQAGADVNIADKEGNTPLHLIFFGQEFRPDIEFPAFHALVATGANRALKNAEGKTAFDLAVEFDYPDEYQRLLDPGAPEKGANVIWLGDEAFAKLLPDAPVSIQMDGKKWPSVAHYFHAQKVDDEEIREHIRQAPTVDAAIGRLRDAQEGQSRGLPSRRDTIMPSGLSAKFEQNQELRQQLTKTGNAILVADANCTNYWYENPASDFNAIGKMLMEIRSRLQAGS